MLQQQRRRAEANHRAPKPAAVLACTRATTQKCFYPQVFKRICNLYPKILRYYSPKITVLYTSRYCNIIHPKILGFYLGQLLALVPPWIIPKVGIWAIIIHINLCQWLMLLRSPYFPTPV